MQTKKLTFLTFIAVLGLALAFAPSANAGGAGITVNFGVGFADATATTSPITGSPSTLGADRIAVFEQAALVWEAVLDISVEIIVDAAFSSQGGTVMGFTPLGFAGATTFFRSYANAPTANRWYPVAEANQHFGSDLDVPRADIFADFNADVDDAILVPGFSWYYGIDGSPPGGTIDFFSTILHELAHGLGFLTIIDRDTGEWALGTEDVYATNLASGTTSTVTQLFTAMNDAQRAAAMISGTGLIWVGSSAVADSTFHTPGDNILMFAPNPLVSGSSVSHWDTTNSPNLLMEPFATDPFTDITLERAAFDDMDWPLLAQVAAPTANFTQDTTSGTPPLTVNFTDTSLPGSSAITTWAWNFGDPGSGGNDISALEDPSHVYSSDGTYTVALTVTSPDGNDTATMVDLITVAAVTPPTANFTSNLASGDVPLTVNFTDTSTAGSSAITTWAWNFGDPGSGVNDTSALEDPSHIYNDLGTYTVALTVTTADGNDVETKVDFITAIDEISFGAASGGGIAQAGDSAVLSFGVTGGAPPVTFQWTRGGSDVVDGGRISGAQTDTLTIDPLVEGDSGTYVLEVTEDDGKALFLSPDLVLTVLAAGSLPAAGLLGLGLLAGAFALIGMLYLRRRAS